MFIGDGSRDDTVATLLAFRQVGAESCRYQKYLRFKHCFGVASQNDGDIALG